MKSKMGRPTRAAEGRAEAVTVRLRPSLAFVLDMVARDRRISTSEAAEFIIASFAREQEVDGKKLQSYAQWVATLAEFSPGVGVFDAHDGKSYTQEEQQEISTRFFRLTGMAKVIFMPERLRTAKEQYFFDVHEAPDSGYWTAPELFLKAAGEGFEQGIDPETAAGNWGAMARAKFAAENPPVKKAKKSRG